MNRVLSCIAVALVLHLMPLITLAEEGVQFHETFEEGAARWAPFDPDVWRVDSDGDNKVFNQFKKETKYMPPHRSPFLIALLKEVKVADFDLRARVKSTTPDYGHRDVCVVFGYQDPAHFYYVHFGKEADDHANQIFIVNDAPRTKISVKSSKGTPWTDAWHTVRIKRTGADIEVFFDDLETPVMTARDEHFKAGQIGLGSFDDTSVWDDVELDGK